MHEVRQDSGTQDAELGLTEGELGHSTVAALTDAEHRRWMTQCRGLEESEANAWPEAESRALVSAVLGCLYGADVATVATPSRAWARANPTMGIVVRRIGCLRELFAQEGVMGGGESTARLAEILDKVTIHSTESALAALDVGDAVPMAEDVAGAAPRPLLTRRRAAYGAVGLLALGALVAVALLAFPSPTHHGPAQASPGAGAGVGSGAPGGAQSSGEAAGTSSGQRTPSVGGPASGSTVVRTVDFGTPVGSGASGGSGTNGNGTPAGGANPGTGGNTGGTSGGGTSGGGTPGNPVTLPGGVSVPLPTLPSVPALTVPSIPTPSIPTLPTPPLPSLAIPTIPTR